MKYTTQTLSKIIDKTLDNNKDYHKAVELVRSNTEGKIWLMGGAVYKTLINELYGFQYTAKDFDFLVEKINYPLISDGWKLLETRFHSPKFKKGNVIVDIVSVNNMDPIKIGDLEGTVENYLKTVPLSIHSVVFDVDNKMLLGDVGIKSILSQSIAIQNKNNYNTCKSMYADDKYDLQKNAELFGFKISPPRT